MKNLKLKAVLAIAAACALVACGGGGSSVTLSQTQQLFLENALASNGGIYSLNANWVTTGISTTLSAAQVSKIEITQSPAGVANGVTGVATDGIQLISTLPTPAGSLATNPNVGTAFIDNGQIYFFAATTPPKYTFVGNDVVIEQTAPGGQIGFKGLVTGYAKVPLTGTLSSAPADMIAFLRPLNAYINPNATFLPGAAYYQRVSTRIGDQLILRDGDNNVSTNPQSATPVALSSTIEQFAVAQPTQLTLSLGAIRTVKGVRCWVNNSSGGPNATGGGSFSPATVPGYSTFCEAGGNVYAGTLNPDGAQSGTNYPSGIASPQVNRLSYQPRFNKAAYDSLKAAVP